MMLAGQMMLMVAVIPISLYPFFGGKVYYWNAGMPWQYKRPWYVEIYQSVAYRLIDVLVTGAESSIRPRAL